MMENRFACNLNALDPVERAHHHKLMEKLLASRRKVEEDERGYKFQFRVPEVLLEELAAWVAAESKCCPFFQLPH